MNLDLGPFGFSIWAAYAVSALCMLGAALRILLAWQKAKKRLAALQHN